jgi:phosphomethylpyrimidine synthase
MYSMAMDPDKARRYKEETEAAGSNVCSMCGSLCSINIDNAAIKFTKKRALQQPVEVHAAAS